LKLRLKTAGISFDRLEEVPPTIEDLFVAATAREKDRGTT
jgi:hypothetical protein